MAAGDMIKNRFQEFTDEQTGTRVVRLTEPDHVSHHMYFYNRMTTADGSHLLYCAEIGGERQLYLMDLASGDAVQLTEGEGLDDYGGLIAADDKHIFYQQVCIPHSGGLERRKLGNERGQSFPCHCGDTQGFPAGEEEGGKLGLFCDYLQGEASLPHRLLRSADRQLPYGAGG